MKKMILLILSGIATAMLAGCATDQAGNDNGQVRTSSTAPAGDNDSASAEKPGWSLGPAIDP
jgi:hypothetical protein